MRGLCRVFFVFWLFAIVVQTQVVPSRPPRVHDPNRQDPSTRAWYEELRKRENVPTGIGSIRETTDTLIAKLQDDARRKLAPTDEEKKAYGDFLKLPNSGLLRFAPEADCTRILDVTNPDTKCLNHYLPGKALAYSFRKPNYAHRAYADIERSGEVFVASGTLILGLITSLDDEPINDVGPENSLVKALAEFHPAMTLDQAAEQERMVTRGISIGGHMFRKIAAINESTTYLMRSVAYRAKVSNLPKTEKPRGSINEDERGDVIVVFRVLRKDADGNYLVLWRQLHRAESPRLDIDLAGN